ncbi:glyoxalase/bleomycin resistance protein/dioxygenase [Gloeomargarita lithophora Alchichica-D10]|uniref:Glyoxalase/bleomycin resistance protein/dioxygenase n=1 Tax=Gloeomargarita lithophora Alchichica-D10 TaxID=1188229 RepID=A0A1J0AB43_9CYAN|nr:VOC family protein [Gloeomargarita lithophora]APB33121.1 glyoxalase/bleomycin resistance protein/dioxygenase [Gloeomargarita lithophora Alchichica-D10]
MPPQHGSPDWFELQTADARGASEFYGELFGWQFEEDQSTGMPYLMLKNGDKVIGGLWQTPASMPVPPHWENYITVTDVDAIAQKIDALGGTLLVPPQDVPNVGRFCTFQDPQGAVLSAITYYPQDV